MKMTIRTTWPQVRSHEVRGHTYWLVDTRRAGLQIPRKVFSNQSEALTYASGLAEQYTNQGKQSLTGVDFSLVDNLRTWTDTLSPYGKDIAWAVNFAVEHLKQQAKITKTTAEYLTDWLNSKLNDNAHPLRAASIRSLKGRVTFFKGQFDGNLLNVVAEKEYLKKWFNGLDVESSSRANYRRYLNDFFNYCIEQGLLTANPLKDKWFRFKSTGEIHTYTFEQAKTMCRTALNTPFMGFVALLLFAGIRPSECSKQDNDGNWHQLTWNDIDFEHNEITISKQLSKQKRQRIIQCNKNDLGNLIEWLKAHKASGLPLIPPQFNTDKDENWREFKKGLGFFGQDYARHTFASFHYNRHQSYEDLEAIMGTSKTYLVGNYQKSISVKTVDAFWGLTPATV